MTVTLTEFFNAVVPCATEGERFELRAKDAMGGIVARAFFQPGGGNEESDFILRHIQHDLYFGCASRVEKNGILKGDTEHCHTAYTLWTDHDFKTTNEATVRALLALIPDPPGIIIHSGGGLHSYWLLAKPIPAGKVLQQWLRDLAYTLHADRGAALVTQILRVPFTRNWKKPDLYPTGRPVVIETFEPSRRLAL